MCVLAHQEAGVQAQEAQALQLTTNPEVGTPENNHYSAFMKSSTWTGLVDLDKADENSLAKTNNSSEISEEHIVIHLQPVEDWEEDQVGPITSQPIKEKSLESEVKKSSGASELANLSRLESHGSSAHEEREDGPLNPSDTPTSSSMAPGIPQHPSSSNVLAEFVKSLMLPFRYLTGAEKAEKRQKGASGVEEKAGENQTQEEDTSSRNLSVPKAARKKGSVDNAIIERMSDSFDFWAPTAGASSPGEGLSEREKETKPLVPLVPLVPRAGQADSKTAGSSPPSSIDGKKPCLYSPLAKHQY